MTSETGVEDRVGDKMEVLLMRRMIDRGGAEWQETGITLEARGGFRHFYR